MKTTSLCIYRFAALAVMAVGAVLAPGGARALPLEHYASESKLAAGHWVKVSVEESSMQLLTEANLRRWGFSDPSQVKVYGYGGDRLPELLTDNYIDDLPQVPSVYIQGKGVVFYGRGVADTQTTVGAYRQPAINPFTLKGYYFVSDAADSERRAPGATGTPGAGEPVTTFSSDVYHKLELSSPGQCGHLLVGEDFRYTPRQEFTVDLPGLVATEPVYFEGSFVASSPTASYVYYSIDGQDVGEGGYRVAANTDSHTHGVESVARVPLSLGKESFRFGIRYPAVASVSLANLNYVNFTYTRRLEAAQTGVKPFRVNAPQGGVSLGSTRDNAHVWDVTDPLAPASGQTARSGQSLSWTADYAT
ncbi:MAG: hypothetical protein K2O10_01765, partial [Muribaculaceae bacterium]|nr:hypothetical protein [Muribaculaceae bacterium]